MNPYSKPTSPSSPSTNIPQRFISSIAKRPLAESGYYRSASKDHASGPSDFTAKEDLEYLKSGYDSARPYLGSSIGSQGGPVTSTHAKLSTSDLAQNYTTNHTNNYATDSNYMSKSIGYSPINGSANTFLSPQRFMPTKVDYSHNKNNNDAQNYYSADANLEQTAKQAMSDNFNIYSKQKDDKQQPRKYSEERLQAILENVRNRKFDDKPRYGNPYSDPKISTPELSNYTKEHRDSFRSEDRPLQIRSQNISGIQVSSNQTTERGNKEILSYLTNTNTVPVKPGPYIDLTLLHGGSAYSNNPASGIASYSPISYTPVNAFNSINITEPTQKPTPTHVSYSSLYDTSKKNPITIENQDALKISKEDEKGFSFRDNKEKEISFQKDSNLLGSSLLQSNYSLKQETPYEYQKRVTEYEPVSQPQPEIKPQTSEQAQPLPHQPKPFDHLKTTAVQTHSDSARLKEQTSPSPYEISNLTSPPVRRHHHLDTASFESNLHLSSADSSMSKKTFYTIEHNNPLAMRAFKDTVAGLAISSTPEKNTNSHFESPSLFEDLQRALSKQNVQINRIIIETVENYPSRGSPNIYRHQPEEYSRPDITAVPSKALFEPPKNINKLVFQEVRKEPSGLRDSTSELIPQKLDYSNPTSSINIVQQSEGGLISNEPSVRGETEPKEVEKRAYESNVSSFAQPKSIPSSTPVFNEEKVVHHQISEMQKSENDIKNSISQYTQEQKPSIKDVDSKNEAESQKSAVLIEEPLNITYSAQPSERNNEEISIHKPEESEKKVDESQQSVKQPASEIDIKSPEFSAQKDLSEHVQETQPHLSINEVVQPEFEHHQDLQEVNKPEEHQQEVEEPENNNFEDAADSQEPEIKRQESEKSDKIEVSENIRPQEEPVLRHRVIEEPKVVEQPEEVKRQVPEEIKKTAVPQNTESKSSNIAVKVVIGLLVVMLLAILGSELMPSPSDD